MGFVSGHPIGAQNNKSKRAIIPARINGHTVPANITALVQDPWVGEAEIVVQGVAATIKDKNGDVHDGVFAPSLAGATPKIGLALLDGTARRIRHAELLVEKADSAGNIAQFAVGVVEPGDAVVTPKGHLQIHVKLNGTLTGFAAVSGSLVKLYVEWD